MPILPILGQCHSSHGLLWKMLLFRYTIIYIQGYTNGPLSILHKQYTSYSCQVKSPATCQRYGHWYRLDIDPMLSSQIDVSSMSIQASSSFGRVSRYWTKCTNWHCIFLGQHHDDIIKETFSALLAICCTGNSLVVGEFPAQRPVTRSFDVSFDLRLNKQLSKQSRGWWFETPSRPLWRHCNDN